MPATWWGRSAEPAGRPPSSIPPRSRGSATSTWPPGWTGCGTRGRRARRASPDTYAVTMGFPRSVDPLPDVQRVLCVFAHPDDVDFGSGGTVAAWVDSGIEVSYLLVTRGDAGGFDATPRDQMPLIRESEQRAAAAVLGV